MTILRMICMDCQRTYAIKTSRGPFSLPLEISHGLCRRCNARREETE